MKFIAAKGAWVAQAQSGPMSLAALGDVTVSSTDGKVIITAAKEVWIGAGGSYIQINGSGIVNGSPGPILEKGASWDVPGPDSQVIRVPMISMTEPTTLQHLYRDDEAVHGAKFEIEYDDGKKFSGALNGTGTADLSSAPSGAGRIKFSPDVRAWESKTQDASLAYKASWNDNDFDQSASKNNN
jgi:uncharacterized protein (DUF2345 family)